MAAPVIHFDYDFSPYGQKTKLLLTAAGVAFQKKDEPIVLPRPDLEALGITYRRIPLLAVGKDVYADSSLIIDVIASKLGKIPTTPADKAYEVWGSTVFSEALAVIPASLLTPEFLKDRAPVFPFLTRPDFKTLRPSGLASFRSRFLQVENEFLAGSNGPFIGGDKISLADIHVIFPIKWALENLGVDKEPGFGKESFPKLYKLLDSLPKFNPTVLSAEETAKIIRESSYTAEGPAGVAKDDPLKIATGTSVSVESLDTTPGAHPQLGKLIGSNEHEIVLEIRDGIHLHFPRIGYAVRPQ